MIIINKIVSILGTATLLCTFAFAQGGKYSPQRVTPSSNASSPVTSPSSTAPDVFEVQYFRNANSDGYYDQIFDIVDPGTNWTSTTAAAPNICADIYVTTPDEELAECCGCLLTPDQVVEGDVDIGLLSNTANGRTVHNGVIKIISSATTSTGGCNPAAPVPTPTLRAWIYHVNSITGSNSVTEEEFASPALRAGEENFLAHTCGDFIKDLSGAGVCGCPTAPGL